ncbi:class I glutamine amidotransferase-like protein [Morchella snyderi]|nr:class I glutamine amidotransferase-like protein [Morchella snyderi]
MRFPRLAAMAALLVCSAADVPALPVNFGVLVFPGFQALDVFGPLDTLNMLSTLFRTNLHIIAETLDPVSTKPRSPAMNTTGSNFGESIVPTHTFATAPALDYIKATFPTLKYLLTVCTGSALAASTGILDGKNATSNKAAWVWATGQGPNVNWVPRARWTVDGNVWTTSGVAAGMDGTFAFVREVYGEAAFKRIRDLVEYMPQEDASVDAWGEYYNTTWPIVS